MAGTGTSGTLVFPIDTVTTAGDSYASVRISEKRCRNLTIESEFEFLLLQIFHGLEPNSSEKYSDVTVKMN